MLMHCSMEDLLAIRDGEGTAAAREHVSRCEVCREELDQIHQRVAALKALPAVRPPRDRWPGIRDAVLSARRKRRWIAGGWLSLAAAAVLVLAVGLGRGVGEGSSQDVTLQQLMAQSYDLEDALRMLDPTSRVLNGRAASAIAELEDRIALLDAEISEAQARSDAGEIKELWRRRVDLMGALVNLHVTRAAYVGL